MENFKEPNVSVSGILEQLTISKKHAEDVFNDDDSKKNKFIPIFQKIEEHLQWMTVLPQVKSIETQMIEHLMALNQEMDHDILKGSENFDEVIQKLLHILSLIKNFQSVRKDISSAKLKLDRMVMANNTLSEDQERVACKEWLTLISVDRLCRSEAIQSLLRNFNNLNSRSKDCLQFLSIFPSKWEIKKRPLIYWWIAEGLFCDNHQKGETATAEDVGNSIFQELINARFIRATNGNKSSIVDGCTVHPLVRFMLISLAREANLFQFDDSGCPRNGYRRLLLSGLEDLHTLNDKDLRDLLTVFNIDQKYLSLKADSLLKMKKVAVLQLGRWQISPTQHIEIQDEESLKGLRTLKHLKYLSLRGISRIVTLPRSLTELISLEILDLRACHNLEKLPSDISSLKNLTHLDMSECYLLEGMPNGLEKLSKLQVLKGFVVGNMTKASCKISDLASFEKLRKLSIYIRTESNAEEKEFKKLEGIKSLRNLTLTWGGKVVIKSFVLPPSLKKLDLRCLPDDKLPHWVDLDQLRALEKLYITGGQLKSLGYAEHDSSSVKILRLKYLKDFTVSNLELKRRFPNAVHLEVTE